MEETDKLADLIIEQMKKNELTIADFEKVSAKVKTFYENNAIVVGSLNISKDLAKSMSSAIQKRLDENKKHQSKKIDVADIINEMHVDAEHLAKRSFLYEQERAKNLAKRDISREERD